MNPILPQDCLSNIFAFCEQVPNGVCKEWQVLIDGNEIEKGKTFPFRRLDMLFEATESGPTRQKIAAAWIFAIPKDYTLSEKKLVAILDEYVVNEWSNHLHNLHCLTLRIQKTPGYSKPRIVEIFRRHIQKMVELGFDVNEQWYQNKPIYHAIKYGNDILVRGLIAAGASVRGPQNPADDATALHHLFEVSNFDFEALAMIDSIVEARADPNAIQRAYGNDMTPLWMVARYNHPLAVRALIKHGAKVEPEGARAPLQAAIAVSGVNLSAAEELINHGASPVGIFITASFYSEKEKFAEKIEKLWLMGFDPEPCLLDAFREKHVPAIQAFIRVGADPNFKDALGWTPLKNFFRYSLEDDALPAIRALMEGGAISTDADVQAARDKRCRRIAKYLENCFSY